LIILTFPLMVFVALAIKLESSGPVLHRCTRVGWNGQQFRLLGFRTTRQVVEQATGSAWDQGACETRSGAFLRYTGITDLPQLVNVLRGDITLVGNIPKIRSLVKWATWVIVALVSGALFKGAHSVLELLEL